MKTLRGAMGLLLLAGLAACSEEKTESPTETSMIRAPSSSDSLVRLVRQLTAGRGITAMKPAPRVRPALVRLGRALAFDKELSGNRDIACMTCHLPSFATGDGRSLSVGQGGVGTGPSRTHPQNKFIARNAPPAFNLHAMGPLFWDGRVSRDAAGVYHTPAGPAITPEMTRVFEFGTLSALPMFPVTNRAEMRGDDGNELASIPDEQLQQIWKGLMRRLGRIPQYRRLFEAAYPGQRFERMTFAHASNAIAGFLTAKFYFDDSPWDRFLAGNDRALTQTQLAGAKDFMSARCSICHNGPALSDGLFHNVAVAQIGPGEGDGNGGLDDFGRMRVTGNSADRYAFRTPPLRNVELTAPYGHDGSIVDLRAFVDHYSESEAKLRSFDPMQLEPLLQGSLIPTADAIMATRDTLLNGVVLPAQTIDEVTAFMGALTDPAAKHLNSVIPHRVPSGLPVDGATRGLGDDRGRDYDWDD